MLQWDILRLNFLQKLNQLKSIFTIFLIFSNFLKLKVDKFKWIYLDKQ